MGFALQMLASAQSVGAGVRMVLLVSVSLVDFDNVLLTPSGSNVKKTKTKQHLNLIKKKKEKKIRD